MKELIKFAISPNNESVLCLYLRSLLKVLLALKWKTVCRDLSVFSLQLWFTAEAGEDSKNYKLAILLLILNPLCAVNMYSLMTLDKTQRLLNKKASD